MKEKTKTNLYLAIFTIMFVIGLNVGSSAYRNVNATPTVSPRVEIVETPSVTPERTHTSKTSYSRTITNTEIQLTVSLDQVVVEANKKKKSIKRKIPQVDEEAELMAMKAKYSEMKMIDPDFIQLAHCVKIKSSVDVNKISTQLNSAFKEKFDLKIDNDIKNLEEAGSLEIFHADIALINIGYQPLMSPISGDIP